MEDQTKTLKSVQWDGTAAHMQEVIESNQLYFNRIAYEDGAVTLWETGNPAQPVNQGDFIVIDDRSRIAVMTADQFENFNASLNQAPETPAK